MILRLLLSAALLVSARAADPAATAPAPPASSLPLVLKDGDTVVLLGDTFFERDYNHGHIETMLTSASGKAVRFRNLGWSGDTPRGESRSYFGPPQEGLDRLQKQLAEIKPTVVIACYGAVDAFNGEAALKDFIASYGRLIDLIQKTTGAAVVLMSPPVVSADTKRWPSLEGHAAKQAQCRDAIREFAKSRGLAFADLFEAMQNVKPVTVNGVTLTETDYRAAAPAVAQSLGFSLDAAAVSSAQSNAALTKLIMEKNRLFFHRWRPQNETYLFGFRKNEQGNNGVEIPQFDPLIAEKEKQIATLRK